eukprot:1314304-Rhodomonas_salina.7
MSLRTCYAILTYHTLLPGIGTGGPGSLRLLRAPMSAPLASGNFGSNLSASGSMNSISGVGTKGKRPGSSRYRDVLSRSAEWWREMMASRIGSINSQSLSLGASMETATSYSAVTHTRGLTWHGHDFDNINTDTPLSATFTADTPMSATFEVQAEYIVPQLASDGLPQ